MVWNLFKSSSLSSLKRALSSGKEEGTMKPESKSGEAKKKEGDKSPPKLTLKRADREPPQGAKKKPAEKPQANVAQKKPTEKKSDAQPELIKKERRSNMAQTIAERLEQVLKNLEIVSPDIEGTAIASGDGLIIASNLPPGVDEDRVGAMSAAISALGERSAAELNRGEVLQVYVKGKRGYVVLTNIGSEAVLIAMTNDRVKLGLLFYELNRAVDEIKNII